MMTRTSKAVLLLGLLMLPGAASAQKLYRCGNQYQDTPCAAGQTEKRLPIANRRNATSASSAVDSDCSAQGERSLKIAWAREAGATADDQLAALPSTPEGALQRRLVPSVYEKRGSAPSIRAAIEADCMAEKTRRKQAQALAAAAAELSAADPAAPAPAAPAVQEMPSSQVVQPGASPDPEAQRRALEQQRVALCSGWKTELGNVRSQQRAGGDPSSMDRLNARKRALEQSLSAQGC